MGWYSGLSEEGGLGPDGGYDARVRVKTSRYLGFLLSGCREAGNASASKRIRPGLLPEDC